MNGYRGQDDLLAEATALLEIADHVVEQMLAIRRSELAKQHHKS